VQRRRDGVAVATERARDVERLGERVDARANRVVVRLARDRVEQIARGGRRDGASTRESPTRVDATEIRDASRRDVERHVDARRSGAPTRVVARVERARRGTRRDRDALMTLRARRATRCSCSGSGTSDARSPKRSRKKGTSCEGRRSTTTRRRDDDDVARDAR